MEYVMYIVFGFWYLFSFQELFLLTYLVRREQPFLRPFWAYIASFAFGTTVTTVLLWLYSSGRLDAWPTIIIGTALFLPEAIYSAWSKRNLARREAE